MPAWVWVIVAIVVIVVIALAVWAAMRKRRTESLRQQFGPEYDRTVDSADNSRDAESELEQRRRRRAELDVRPLAPGARTRYADEWRSVQARFVDDPPGAVGQADTLVTQVMRERGYPMDDFEQRAADVSVDHPDVVDDYRSAHDISTIGQRPGRDRGSAPGDGALPRPLRAAARGRRRRRRAPGHLTSGATRSERARPRFARDRARSVPS
jgi:hypothetical protein